jgi:hypothetical protein
VEFSARYACDPEGNQYLKLTTTKRKFHDCWFLSWTFVWLAGFAGTDSITFVALVVPELSEGQEVYGKPEASEGENYPISCRWSLRLIFLCCRRSCCYSLENYDHWVKGLDRSCYELGQYDGNDKHLIMSIDSFLNPWEIWKTGKQSREWGIEITKQLEECQRDRTNHRQLLFHVRKRIFNLINS